MSSSSTDYTDSLPAMTTITSAFSAANLHTIAAKSRPHPRHLAASESRLAFVVGVIHIVPILIRPLALTRINRLLTTCFRISFRRRVVDAISGRIAPTFERVKQSEPMPYFMDHNVSLVVVRRRPTWQSRIPNNYSIQVFKCGIFKLPWPASPTEETINSGSVDVQR